MDRSRAREIIMTIVVFMGIFLWLFYSVSIESNRTSQLRSELVAFCERTNELRESHNEMSEALRILLMEASHNRSLSDEIENLDAAISFRERAASLTSTEAIDCQEVVGDI